MSQELIHRAKELGFIAVGFSRPDRPLFMDQFLDFIREERHASMEWLARNIEIRKNPELLLKDCKTIISFAYPYSEKVPITTDGFSVARYSEPMLEDYHTRIRKMLRGICVFIESAFTGARTRICVDSAPILERSFAYASGMGFIGKNNMLIVPGQGSFFYLAEILTTAPLEFEPQEPMASMCGSCNRCIENCPAGALKEPYLMDAGMCLSYLSIEHKGEIDERVASSMGRSFFGCDRCQEVCPFNRDLEQEDVVLPSTDEILSMSQQEFDRVFGESVFSRAGLKKIKQNIRSIRGI
jgi:epoxyqueuosine reductase